MGLTGDETMTTQTWKSVKGTKIEVGNILLTDYSGTSEVTAVEQKQHPMGARFALVTLANGETEECWEGFLHRVRVSVELTLENATITELAVMP